MNNLGNQKEFLSVLVVSCSSAANVKRSNGVERNCELY